MGQDFDARKTSRRMCFCSTTMRLLCACSPRVASDPLWGELLAILVEDNHTSREKFAIGIRSTRDDQRSHSMVGVWRLQRCTFPAKWQRPAITFASNHSPPI